MRQLSVQEFEDDPKGYLAQAEAGQRLVLHRGGKAVLEIGPSPGVQRGGEWRGDEEEETQPSSEERQAAVKRLMLKLNKGYDLGGLRIENRDELYEDA